MDVKTLLSILSSPETRELLLKAVDFARVKGQVNDMQNQVRRLQADLKEDSEDIERLDDKLSTLAKSIDALRTRALVGLGLGGGAFLLALVALIVALR
jgi:septal ring factor EnvC (AmiA/AmiB activator)